jgi:polysaccharide biosynthesis transport protein
VQRPQRAEPHERGRPAKLGGERGTSVVAKSRVMSEDTSEIDWIFQALRKHLALIALVIIAMTLLATAFAILRTKQYTAYTQVLIEEQAPNFSDLQERTGFRLPTIGPEKMESEIKLAGSVRVLRQVLAELDLSWPEQSSWNPVGMVRDWLRGDDGGGSALLDPDTENLRRLRERLTISRDPLAFVISIGYTSTDPEEAALVANTVAETYLEDRIAAERRAVSETAGHLRRSTEAIGAWLKSAEREIERYRGETDLYSIGGASTAEERYRTLSEELTRARIELDRASARFSQINRATAEGRPFESLREVQSSPVIAELRRQETVLRGQLADLSSQYGPKHPVMQSVQGELDGVRSAIRDEINRGVEQLRHEEEIARARFDQVEGELNQARAALVGSEPSRIRLRELERNAAAQRRVYEAMLDRFQRAREQERVLVGSAEIISPAMVPQDPSNLSGFLLIGMTAAGSCAAGVGLALLMEIRQRGYTSASHLERELNCLVLAVIPRIPDAQRRSRRKSVEVSAFVEGIRCILQYVAPTQYGESARNGKVIAITSCFAGEGKTTLAMSLARQAGFGGLKVLLIEGDLRKSGLRDTLQTVSASTGLPHVLKGTARSLEEAIVTEPASSVDIMLGFGPTPEAFTLLRSAQMAVLIRGMKQRYDLILLDTPPLMVVSDARSLVGLADQVLYVVRWKETDRSAVRTGIRDLQRGGADLAGVVLNDVKIGEYVKYSSAERSRYQGYRDYAVEI